MSQEQTEILIVGGGTGGFAAAIAACQLGSTVILTEETDWVGGQLTAQIVPPDEHPWIELFGCTRSYRDFRNAVRQLYREHGGLTDEISEQPWFNPGGGWVSKLCFLPNVGHAVLREMAAPFLESGALQIWLKHKPFSADVEGDVVRGVTLLDLREGSFVHIEAKVVVDATELGDLLAMAKVEYVSGAESKSETGEPNAVDGPAEPDNVQGLTWCFALQETKINQAAPEPEGYQKWKSWKPDFWPGPLLGFDVLHAHTGEKRELPLYGRNPGDWYALFPYRQVITPSHHTERVNPATIVNWPQNDYFESNIIDVDPLPTGTSIPEGFETPGAMGAVSKARLNEAKNLSRSLLYWLQTDAPRHDDQPGAYPTLAVAPEVSSTLDGFAKYPYIRESRRILAIHTIKEQDVAAYTNPGKDRAPSVENSVGIGAYRIDLHPSTNGKPTIDTSTLPFEIPFESLVPVRVRNLIPACKNIGTTHITNGCYRLHPVEWNIGEAAGTIAHHMVQLETVVQDKALYAPVRKSLLDLGVELQWPQLRAL